LYIEICLNWFGGRKLDTSLPRQMNIARTAGETLSNIAGGKRWNPKSRPPGVENSRSCWNKKNKSDSSKDCSIIIYLVIWKKNSWAILFRQELLPHGEYHQPNGVSNPASSPWCLSSWVNQSFLNQQVETCNWLHPGTSKHQRHPKNQEKT
jgi:hypothetical protein